MEKELPIILLVEDKPDEQELLRVKLLKIARVLPAMTKKEALDLFEKHRAEIVLIGMDACLEGPKPDTMPLVHHMRKAGFTGPIVAMSGHPDNNDQLVAAGCDHKSNKDSFPYKAREILKFLGYLT